MDEQIELADLYCSKNCADPPLLQNSSLMVLRVHFGVRQNWILILKCGICITDFIREGWTCSGAGGVEVDGE